ncbi:aspartyl aminopeptidase [Breznakibacter xylanolyticus]|uniref:M18 family aminopeptidase n=1 Tax=Breznakibacter xylanolyticus TaxID=990 RepID=A0A2W7MX65_9BACT|nr:M18 family aminopeptidase [Breznakibacter xylanolyticus]PZX12241.1 aspartyl aminopeptidase [Breznakibacter xylanolyticus]
MITDTQHQATCLIDFIQKGCSPFHVVQTIERELLLAGYQYLPLEESWSFDGHGKYFTRRNGTAIIAWQTGSGEAEVDGFRFIAAHSDSPGFKIKPSPEMCVENHFIKLNTEVYGGPVLMSWLDRPLSLAGRVTLRSDDVLRPQWRLVNIDKPLLIIPGLAIHMNRGVNEGVELNKQKDMLPLMGISDGQCLSAFSLKKILAAHLEVSSDDVLDFDLFMYEYERGCTVGLNDELISASRVDNLAMVHAGLQALLHASPANATQMLVVFDNEEVGSVSKQGAGAPLLRQVVERLLELEGKSREQQLRAIYNSFMVSADMAHSLHPNYPEKHDPVLRPVINGGIVLKYHAGQKYTTDADSAAVFEMVCRAAGVPVQRFVNRSDMAGGSTLGNISSTQLDVRTVDVGSPMLAMHSVRELCGVEDHTYAIRAFLKFFEV